MGATFVFTTVSFLVLNKEASKEANKKSPRLSWLYEPRTGSSSVSPCTIHTSQWFIRWTKGSGEKGKKWQKSLESVRQVQQAWLPSTRASESRQEFEVLPGTIGLLPQVQSGSGRSWTSWIARVTLHNCEVASRTSQMLAHAIFSDVCLTIFPFKFRPQTFTIDSTEKKLQIRAYDFGVQCSFNSPIFTLTMTWYSGPGPRM